MSAKHYRTYADFLREHFTVRVQKLPVDAGFTCPNRDGSKGRGGCIYCNNHSFVTSYCHTHQSVTQQLEQGKQFFAGKYPQMKYLAYFQGHTGTYGALHHLKSLYEEALAVPGVEGVVIATRPDCVDTDLLAHLQTLQERCFVMMEYGVETLHNATLRLINRCHDAEASISAIKATHAAGIPQCVHLILGLPGETHAMMLHTIRTISALPVDVAKFHQLQILKHTPLAQFIDDAEWTHSHRLHPFTLPEYIALCAEVVRHLSPGIAIERFVSESPAELLLSPKWGVKPDKFQHLLHQYLEENNIFQGKL